jgi:chromosomal replication initiator protein
VGERNYSIWMAPLRPQWTASGLVLEAPTPAVRTRVERHFARVIEDAVAATVGIATPVVFSVARDHPPLPIPVVATSSEHTFASFVVGRANAAAVAAARARIDGDRTPLAIHGPSGVGKTHLLHAMLHELEDSGTPSACLPAARFVASMVAAYGAKAVSSFWADLAQLGALLLDDLHSLAGQDAVQEQLMEGLSQWVEAGRLLVLTCDRPPHELPGLTGRLPERFVDGVVVPIEPADPALRLAILQRKAHAQGVSLDAPLALRLASQIGGNVRRLEGALTTLVAHARLLGRRIDQPLADEVLPELRVALPGPVSVERIVEETAVAFGAAARAVLGRSRRPGLVLPRQVAMYLARRILGRPFAELSRAFSRDHTTVIHAWRSIAGRLETDERLAALVGRIERRLGIERPGDDA